MKVNEDNDLWKLVRQRLSKSEHKEIIKEEENSNSNEFVIEEKKENIISNNNNEKPPVDEKNNTNNFPTIKLLNEGIFAGFAYIFVIMTILGMLTIPGSITAAIGGFFGGKKAGNPAKAMTAAMLPFLLIASFYFLASTGALPPGSGPNDVSNEINNMLNNNIDDSALGPISNMPDSNSSVFISVVTFAFIGGLVQSEERSKKKIKF